MKRGFTLSELMLVVTIIAILAVITFLSFQKQTTRGYDAKRKADISQFRVLLEDYYNDHDCYPTKAVWNAYDCKTKANGEFLQPYLDGKNIPCDPVTNERYLYITLPEDAPEGEPACKGYKLFAALGNTSDPDIINSGCDPHPLLGCGYVPYTFNYGIATGGNIANSEFDFTAPIATVTPSGEQGNWVCTPQSLICQNVTSGCQQQVAAAGCSTYADSNICTLLCISRLNVCPEVNNCQ